MLSQVKLGFLLCCFNFCAAEFGLAEDFFSKLSTSINVLGHYQTRVSEKLAELCLLFNQAKFTLELIDKLDDPTDEKTLLQSELQKEIKQLRAQCWDIILPFQNAHGVLIFKHDTLLQIEQKYLKALNVSFSKPMPETLVKLSAEIKEGLRELSQVIGDKDAWTGFSKRTVLQKQFQCELRACEVEIQTLHNCLSACKKSHFINKKLAETEARKRALEVVVNKFDADLKSFLNRYGARCLDTCFKVLLTKETSLKQNVLILSKQKQAEFVKFIGLDVVSFTLEQSQTFYSAKKCIDNYKTILAELSSFVENAKL